MTNRSADDVDGGAVGIDVDRDLEPSTRVAYRLAEETGRPVDDLEPLADSVDPEALDAIFRDRAADHAHVAFRHEGHSITVTGAGQVLVDPVDAQ